MATDPALAIAGPYDATWGTNALGCTENGWEFSEDVFIDALRDDCHGDMTVEAILRGAGVSLSGSLTEWSQAGVQAIQNFGSALGTATTGAYTVNNVGKLALADGVAVPLVLTPIVASTARKTYTVHLTIPASRRFNLNSRRRVLPVSFMCFPTTATVPGTIAANTLFTMS